jgi:hypothetical protein
MTITQAHWHLPRSTDHDYEHLRKVDRSIWAWEWLRRNPEFDQALAEIRLVRAGDRSIVCNENPLAATLASRWGLHLAAAA